MNSYTVTFKIGADIISEEKVEYGTAITVPEAPAKEGYTFSGWGEVPKTMPAGDLVIEGSYTVNSYTVTFKIGEDVISEEKVEYGAAITVPDVPEKEGYTFSGWGEVPKTMPAEDIVIEGSYTVNSYTVTFKIGEDVVATLTLAYGTAIEAPEAPEKEGYTFDGWKEFPKTMPAEDIVIEGSYSVNTYTATFKIGEMTIAELKVAYGAAIEVPSAPEKDGYTFDGWKEVPATMPAEDIIIEGSYSLNIYKAVFKIDGETIATLDVPYGAAIETPAVTEKEGYTFGGWDNLPEAMPASDIEVTGSYTVNIYKAVFVIDGATIATLEVAYGAAVEAPEAPEKEGYTFDGWKDVPETMPARDIEIEGSYTRVSTSYTVTFVIDGKTVHTATVEAGESITLPEAPEKEGHTFAGWQGVPEVMPSENITVTGSYTVNSYTATFIIDGMIVETLSIEYGAAVNAPAAPGKEDHTFAGWQDLPATMPAHDIAVTGTYTYSPDIFKAVFMIDGETIATLEVSCGSAIKAPEAPAKVGHTFAGWRDIPSEMPHHDVVIEGSYTVNSYNAVFVIDGETIETLSVEYGAVINAPIAPAKEDYIFDGWKDVPETMPAHDIEVTGSYTYSPDIFNVVFMADNEVIASYQLECGTPITAPRAPVKKGYTFSGWQDVPEVVPHHDVTITGTFIPNVYSVIFVVDGEVIETAEVECGAVITAPEMPEKEYHTFSGWLNLPEVMPAKSIEVVGNYHADVFHAVFVIDGSVFERQSVEYGAVITAPVAPEREDYTFSGWQNLPETMPGRDIEVTGSYTYSPDLYKAVFMIDGEIFATLELEPGQAITAPSVAEREGHTFSGWQDVPAEMPNHDVTVSGSYTVNSYNAVFVIDGEIIATLSVEYGAAINVPAAPDKEDYTFDGWKDVPATMPARDIAVSGSYTYSPDIFSAVFMIDGETYATVAVEAGEPVELPAEPFREGHTFSDWQDVPDVMPNHDIVVSGSFTVNSYQAIFVIDNEILESLTVEYGAPVNAPAAPEKENHTFTGWLDLPATMPAHDIAVTGTYAYSSGVFNAVFMIDGQTVATVQAEAGKAIALPEAPAKEGHTFAGWQDVPSVMPHHDVTVSGSFTVNSYDILFVVNGEVIKTVSVEYGATVEAPEMPEKEGYSFSGWLNLPATMPAKSMEVVGNYHADIYHAVFVIDGRVFETHSVEYGSVITVPAAPERENYTFSGWQNVPETMPARDIEVTGSYTYSPDSFKAVFMIDGEVLETRTFKPGAAVTVPEAAEREGYTFSGWQDVPETMPHHDVTVSGSYTVNSYQVIFIIEGEMTATLNVEYGSVINAPAAPEREDYRFDGWKDLPETMPAHDVVVTGSYTYSPDIFNAVFMIGEETYATIAVEAGEPVVLPAEPFREGHTFSGWQEIPSVMPNHDIVISGSYTANSYQAIFMIDGEVLESLMVEYGTVINAPAAPEKEGLTFTGWLDLPATMPAHDIVLTGSYVDSDGKYLAVFMIDGETIASILVEDGEAIELPEAPAKEGHSFAGWQDVPSVMPNHDVVINGSYTVNSYDVIFIVNGETIETATVEYGATVVAPEMAEREGYTFSGWLNLPETMPAQSIEVVGNYHANLYTATFIIDGEVFETVSIEYGSVISVPVAPEKEDYTFDGWQNLPETMPAHDIEVTGSYTYSPDTFKAVFMIDGEIFETIELEPGDAINAPAAPEREGHSFSGWQDMPEVMPNHDVVISGSYTVNSYTATFVIDGETVESMSVEYGAVINVPAAPEKEDYRFDGWQDVPEIMPARDIVIEGSYTYSPDLFNAVFMIDGETIATITVEAGEPVILPAEPFREGHTFAGWQDVPEVMPNHDITVNGSFTLNSYTVVFMVDDEIFDSRRADFGSVIEAPEAPERDGYTFAGWNGLPATMPATDLVVSALYDPALYRLLIYLDGEVYMDEQLAFGTEIVVPEPEVPAGYVFDGWDIEIPATMPAHNLVIYGTLSIDPSTWIGALATDGKDSFTIYDLNGALLFKDAKAAEVKDQLTPGVYIINGHKVMVK